MKKSLYLCVVLLLSVNMMAQIEAIEDRIDYCHYHEKHLNVTYPQTNHSISAGWMYNSHYSDEFNGSVLNSNKWTKKDHYYHPNNPQIGYLAENVSVSNGKLVISVRYDEVPQTYYYDSDHPTISTSYSTGGIVSNNKIRYGYYEIECYLPKNHKYKPCFWTVAGDAIYDEIDVFELTNSDNSPYKIQQNEYSNLHDPTTESKTRQYLTLSDSITGKTSRFGVEVFPYEIVFYINGHVSSRLQYDPDKSEAGNTFTCSDITKTIPMQVRLTFNTFVQNGIPQPHEDFTVNYFRCYKLSRGTVDTYHPTIFTPSEESCKVYPHVILGGTGYTANITSPTSVWAEQDIILDKGFSLAAGTEFCARVIYHGDENPATSPLYLQNCPH